MSNEAPIQVSSPDGRAWTVTLETKRLRMRDTKDEPFFVAHVIVTTIIVGVLIWIFRHDWGGIWAVLLPLAVVVWAIGFVAASIKPYVRAETPGPPPEHRLWSITKRSRKKKCVRDVTASIKQGQFVVEPPGTRLEEI